MRAVAVGLLGLALALSGGCDDPLPDAGYEGADACSDPSLGTVQYFEQTMIPEFFEPYCLTCHSTTVQGAARRGAPGYLDFDAFDSATSVNAATWSRVASREMPPMAKTPSTAELELLVDWLNCTAPISGLPEELAAACPDDSLTYVDDVGPIFEQRCTSCHSSALGAGDRGGAPESANYDTAAGARAVGEALIWRRIRDEEMPLGGPPVPEDEARVLHAWLSCGAPE